MQSDDIFRDNDGLLINNCSLLSKSLGISGLYIYPVLLLIISWVPPRLVDITGMPLANDSIIILGKGSFHTDDITAISIDWYISSGETCPLKIILDLLY